MAMKNYIIEFFSYNLGRSVNIRCLVPTGANLKCLFLLHGYDGDHNQWCEASDISLLAERYELVVVMPSCGNGYYEDTQEDIPKFIGEELVPYIRKVLPVSQHREETFIGGVSMGGFGALLLGAKYSCLFGKIVSLSGAFIISDVAIGNQGVLGNSNPQYFKDIFGNLETLEGSERDPIAEMLRTSKTTFLPSVFLLCGTEDILFQANMKVVKVLRKHRIPIVWYFRRGSHQWHFWNNVLPYVLKWLVDGHIPECADTGDIANG